MVTLAKQKLLPKEKIVEFKGLKEVNLGDSVTVDQFQEGEFVDVVGTSKGKGFQGVVKRHNFGGVGQSTRPAQQNESSWFYWCRFLSCQSF